jgi:membrane-associated protease RseP (regulator of RpoE activity)
MRFLSLFAPAALLGLLSSCGSAAVPQQTQPGVSTAEYTRGCRGDAIQRTMDVFGVPTTYPIVTEVQPGSPAEIAGLEPGDTLTSMQGVDLLTGTRPALRFAVGDTLRIIARRAGRDYPVLLILGVSEPGEAPGARRVCRPA